jgi:hypothetical protein
MMTVQRRLFAVFSCKRIEYTFEPSLEKFRLEEFSKDITQRSGAPFKGEGISFVAPTRSPRILAYQAHFSCRVERRKFRASLEYVDGSENPDRHETRPFADELMGWIGRFFRNEQVTAGVEGTFSYPVKKFESILPMPMRLSLSRKQEVEVTAMSVFVSGRPAGVYSAFVALDDDDIAVDVFGERIVRFKAFDVRSDLLPLSSMARLFVREMTR